MIEKIIIDEILNVCNSIYEGNLNDSINMSNYNNTVKPILDGFKKRNKTSPNILFNNELKSIKKEKKLDESISSQGFQVRGRQKIHSYFWATLFSKKEGYWNSAQLYILASEEGIKFGIGYGVDVENESKFVKTVKDNISVNERLYSIISSNNYINFYNEKPGSESFPREEEVIELKSGTDLASLWSAKSNVIGIFRKDNIPLDAGKIIHKILNELVDVFNEIILESKSDEGIDEELKTELEKSKESDSKPNYPLNQILYGPPGTGKTYHTIDHALKICGEDITGLDRPEIKRRYNQLVKDGQIVFTTFHQSMSYEDFIEGIKPLEPEEEGGQVIYKIVDGIFKKACIEAAFNFAEEHASDQKEMQLDFSLAYDQFKEEIEEELALENQVILKTKSGGNIYVDGITSQGNMLIKHKDGVRAYVVSKPRLSKLNKAISDLEEIPNIYGTFGKIIGGSNASAYWAVLNAIRKNKNIPKENKQIQREYSWEDKVDVVQSLDSEIFKVKTAKPVVVIIDEINRGNVSSIFGELITLIETDKRLGQPEELLNVLPYSKEPFGVPPNLYIIGTMNTADRSVEALDTALRRRFSFIEMLPNPKKLADQHKMKDIDLEKLLETINKRVELLIDRDHTIGHSYFMNINSAKELAEVFKDKVMPLLQEYFYGDFGKIGLVLGKKFIQKNENNKVDFADFPYENPEDYKNDTYTLEDINETNIIDAVSELLRTKESE